MTMYTLAVISDALVIMFPVGGSMLLAYGIYQVVSESRTSNRRKMQDRLRGASSRKIEEKESSILRRGAKPEASVVESMLGRLSVVPKFQTLLDQADVNWSAANTLINLSLAAVLAAVVIIVFAGSVIGGAACGLAILLLPLGILSFMRSRRLSKLTNQLPDVFEMMSQALRAGQSLAGAIQLVQEQLPPPISTEFARVYHEQNLGIKVEEALQSMANRVESLDVRFFVTAVMIQRQTGGDLATVLDNISGVIRGRIELQGLVRGLTAEGRLSGWVLFALPAVVFAGSMYMNPNYATVLLEDPRGKVLLMIAGGMQLMGIAMIRWIVNIKI